MSAVAAAALPLAAGVALGGSADASSSRAVLAGSRPQWAAGAATAAAPRSKQVQARVYIAPRNKTALEAFIKAVSDPASSSYRHYLSTAQYQARYAPTSTQVTAVQRWLRSAGLSVSGAGAANRYVEARGTVAQAQDAFGTKLGLFHHKGAIAQAPATDLTVPAELAGTVDAVTGLDEGDHRVKPATSAAPPPNAFANARPCSQYYGQLQARYQADFKTPLPKFEGSYRPYAVCGYVPSQLRGAYEGNTKLTGKGVTVAITDAYAAPTIVADSNRYATRHGDAAFRRGQFSQSLPGSFSHQQLCGPSGWYGEETLDVQAVHGMAPDANVAYYASKSCLDGDFFDTLARVVDDNKASIVSNSWGGAGEDVTAGEVHAYTSVFLQGAAQGIGFFFSSGDSGDEAANTGTVQADWPATDPYVTAVGGTSLAVGRANNYQFEAGWGTDKYSLSASGKSWDSLGFLYGAGGGFSHLFNRPSYQVGVVNRTHGGRAVPDVGMDADPTTGMLIGETQTFPGGAHYGEYRIGGTSLASPLMAGVQALATQRMGRLGFANPRIYALARAGGGAFRDVTSGHDGAANVRPDFANGVNPYGGIVYSVRTFDDDSSLSTTRGWDDVTGVGSPTRKYFGG